MAFWRRSEDPWDRDPAKKRVKREREPAENPLDALKNWNEERKAKAAAKRAELEALPKETCPWCGEEMERGYFQGGRDRITWTPGFLTTKAAWLGPSKEARERRLRVYDEGDFTTYKTVWYCRGCEKMVINAAGMREADAGYVWPESSGSPYAQELDGYFRDAKGDGEEGERT